MADPNELDDIQRIEAERSAAERTELERTVVELRAGMASAFPGQFETVDRQRWDAYVFADDANDDGRWLKFYSGEAVPESPRISFIKKKDGGLLVSAENNPYHDPDNKISQPSGSIYYRMHQGNGVHWPVSQTDELIEATKTWMEGIPLTPDVLDKPAFLVGQGNEVVTIRSLIHGAQEFKAAYKQMKKKPKGYSMKAEMKERFQPKNLYTLYEEQPDVVRDLVISRLTHQTEPYVSRGVSFRMDIKM